jgi:hypothetical protein
MDQHLILTSCFLRKTALNVAALLFDVYASTPFPLDSDWQKGPQGLCFVGLSADFGDTFTH